MEKKKVIWIIIAIFLIVVLYFIFSKLDYFNKGDNEAPPKIKIATFGISLDTQDEIDEFNKKIYLVFECQMNCPLNESEGVVFFTEECKTCLDDSIPNELLAVDGGTYTNDYEEALIINAPEFTECVKKIFEERNAREFQSCMERNLPILKERYNINS